MSETDFVSREFGDGENRAIASLVGGIGDDLGRLDNGAMQLQQAGYDVVTYAYNPDVLTCGDPHALPELVLEIKEDFGLKSKDYSRERHAGASLGGGIAWNLQKNAASDLEPGIYAAAGTDVARLIMKNLAFRAVVGAFFKKDIKKEYILRGHDEESIRHIYGDLQTPPDSGFALALGTWDPTTRFKEVSKNVSHWVREGKKIEVVRLPRHGHSGTNSWFLQNIVTMLGVSSTLK